jgi:hypothetical protein
MILSHIFRTERSMVLVDFDWLFWSGFFLWRILEEILQVIDGPESKDDGGDDSTKAKNQNGSISTIECRPNSIPDFFSVPATGSGTLRTTKSWPLLFKIQTRTFGLLLIERSNP